MENFFRKKELKQHLNSFFTLNNPFTLPSTSLFHILIFFSCIFRLFFFVFSPYFFSFNFTFPSILSLSIYIYYFFFFLLVVHLKSLFLHLLAPFFLSQNLLRKVSSVPSAGKYNACIRKGPLSNCTVASLNYFTPTLSTTELEQQGDKKKNIEKPTDCFQHLS